MQKIRLEVWGLDTKASACNFCPFHKNYFFKHLKENSEADYDQTVAFDRMIGEMQPNTAIRSKIYISRLRICFLKNVMMQNTLIITEKPYGMGFRIMKSISFFDGN